MNGGRRVRRVLRPDVNPVYKPPPTPKPPTTKRRRRWSKFALWAIVFGLIIGLWWFVFQVRDIKVSGSGRPAEIETRVRQAISSPFWHRHLFWLRPQTVAETILRDNPQLLASVSIKKDWVGRALLVEVEDRQAVIRWSSNSQEYGVDQRGIVSGALGEGEAGNLPLVIDSSNLDVSGGTAVAPSQFVAFVRGLQQQLEPRTGLAFVRGRVIETTNELLADTSAGYYLRLDTTKSVEEQSATLKTLLDRGIKPTEYIDLRLVYKVYYR